MYYPCRKNKCADQLPGYHKADLRLCFRICRLLVFSRGRSNYKALLTRKVLSNQPGAVYFESSSLLKISAALIFYKLSGHLQGNDCSHGLQYVVLVPDCQLEFSHLDFKGGTLVMIALLPDHCLPLP